MASTYSTNLRLELIGTGEQQGSWGVTTNTNLGTLLEQAIGGYASVAVTDGADTTLTTVNGATDQSRNMTINLTGALTATRNVICPAIQKVYIVKNATSGGFAVTFKVSGQTGVSVPNGSTSFIYVDGTDARIVSQNPTPVAYGGTGATTAAAAATNLGLGTGDSPQFTAVNIGSATDTTITRVSAGVIAVEGKTVDTFPSGTLMLFQQTAAPTGWTKQTAHNNKALRVVTGTASSGGTTAFTSVFTSRTPAGTIGNTTPTGTVGSTTLSSTQMPSHTHDTPVGGGSGSVTRINITPSTGISNGLTSSSAGGNGSHSHSLTMDAHSHTFTGTAMDFDVQYVDLIIASKD